MNKPAIEGGQPVREDYIGYGSQSINKEDKEAVKEALEGDYITRGPTVEEFEEKVAELIGVDHAIAVTSGTTALHLAGKALGFSEGDEVITTPFTFASTAYSATYSGAEPVFADIKSDTRNIDPEKIEEKITENTEAIVPMHYGGQPAEIEKILDIADKHDLKVLWDACHSFGSEMGGEIIGSERDLAMFSFHPVKNITTAEGGIIVTDDHELAERIRSLRSFTMNSDVEGHEDEPWYQVVEDEGYNYNFTDIQAALGLSQLERVEEFKKRRQEIFDRYTEAFREIKGVEPPEVKESVDPFWHIYTVKITEDFPVSRKKFFNAMQEENIGVQVHYVPLHHHPFFQENYGYEKGDFPQTEEVYSQIVTLPMYPDMSDSDLEDVIEAVRKISKYY
jgi:dTDP-4-amino-4,6-dideoxygalactose transaminase